MKESNSISIRDFTDTFVGIDIQILQLHQCSSDDFLGLNADFKKYYRQSKNISNNATQIFQALTQTETKHLLRDIEILYKDLKNFQIHFSNSLNNTISFLKGILNQLDKIYLPAKNLNQDLLTLKFLLANLRISNSTLNQSDTNTLEAILTQYNLVINDFKVYSIDSRNSIEGLYKAVKDSLHHFESIAHKNISDLESILNNIHLAIMLFAEKHQEVSLQIPALAQKTESTSQSIAEIITNLQYHDIIRQKMQHVQATHNKLLDELVECVIAPDTDAEQKRRNLFARIRDIANLQSAQLVFANKEYQKAIETITSKFLAISNDLSIIANMCHNINAAQDNSEEFYLQNLLDKLNNTAEVLGRFMDAEKNYSNHIDILNEHISRASFSVCNFSTSIQSLKTITASTQKAFEDASITDKELEKSLTQVNTLYLDIEKFENEIRNVLSSIRMIGNKMLPNIGDNINGIKGDKVFEKASQSMADIINHLNEKNLKVNALLDETLILTKTVSNDVRESIEKIKY